MAKDLRPFGDARAKIAGARGQEPRHVLRHRARRLPATNRVPASTTTYPRDFFDLKYAEHGATQFKLPEILEVAPFNELGNVFEIAARFGKAATSCVARSQSCSAACTSTETDIWEREQRDQSIRLRRRGLDGSPIHCHRRVSVLYMASIERCGGNHGNWLGVREQSHPGGAHSR